MGQPPDSGKPGSGENPFEDSEARLDTFLGDLGKNDAPFTGADQETELNSRAQGNRTGRDAPRPALGSSFFSDLEAAHVSPMYSSGTIINERFEIVKQLGAGGMGAVYLSNDLHLKDQKALKVMLPGLLESKEAQERFIIEVKALQNLAHPGIVRVFDFGRDNQTGTYFFSMEYVEGATLNDMLIRRGGRLPVADATNIVLQLLDVLSYAHDYLIHRDLKPLNIMLRPDGKILVLDFGLAKMMTPGQLTHSSMVLGTVYYQSPEQSIRPGEVDKRSDLYSVGVILYQLLTGEVPVGNIHPPSKKNPDVTRALDGVVMRCLESSPDTRFQTAEEVAEALKRVKKPRRRKGLALMAAGLVLTCLVAVAFQAQVRDVLQAFLSPDTFTEEKMDGTRTTEAPDTSTQAETHDAPDATIAGERQALLPRMGRFQESDLNATWAPIHYQTISALWNATEAKWADGALDGLAEDYAALRTHLEAAESEASEAQSRWAETLTRAESELAAAVQRATEAQVATHATEERKVALANVAEAHAARSAGEWSRADDNYRAAIDAYDVATEKAASVAETMRVLAHLDGLETTLQEAVAAADAAKAALWAPKELNEAKATVERARSYRAQGELESARIEYDGAIEGLNGARSVALKAAHDEATRIAATSPPEPKVSPKDDRSKTAMTSGANPIVGGSDGDSHDSPKSAAAMPQKLSVSPSRVTLRSSSDRGEIKIALNGRPVGKGEIKGYQFTDGDRVNRMFEVGPDPKAPDTLCVLPREARAEAGSYTLQIVGDGLLAKVQVDYSPNSMTELPADRSATGSNVIERISVTMPPFYTTGQYVVVDLKGRTGRVFTWKINDRVVLEGVNESLLKVPAAQSGTYAISVDEFLDGELKSHWAGSYNVRDEAPWPIEATQNVPTTFRSSNDFGDFGSIQWSIDGKVLARTSEYTHVFTQQGDFDLICHGSDPAPGEKLAFRRLCYRVTVR